MQGVPSHRTEELTYSTEYKETQRHASRAFQVESVIAPALVISWALLYTVSAQVAIIISIPIVALVSLFSAKYTFFFLALATLMRPASYAELAVQDGWVIIMATFVGVATHWLISGARLRRREIFELLLLIAVTVSSFYLVFSGKGAANRHIASLATVFLFLLLGWRFAGDNFQKWFLQKGRRYLLVIGVFLVAFTAAVAQQRHGFSLGYTGFISLRFVEMSPRSFVGVTGAIALAAMFITANGQKWRVIDIAMLTVIFLGLVFAGMRIIFVAIALAAGLALLFSLITSLLRNGRVTKAILGIFCFFIFAGAAIYLASATEVNLRAFREVDLEQVNRLYYWSALIESMSLVNWLLGSGLGAEAELLDAIAHSFYVSYFFVFGAPVVACLSLIIARELIHALYTVNTAQIAVIIYCLISYSAAGTADWPDFFVSYLLVYMLGRNNLQRHD